VKKLEEIEGRKSLKLSFLNAGLGTRYSVQEEKMDG
jgi:hypothetical protein